MSVTSHLINSCFAPVDDWGNVEMIDFAASSFRPTRMILAFPLMWEANADAVPWPTPEVPPTKTATGRVFGFLRERVVMRDALARRKAGIDGVSVNINNIFDRWGRLYIYFNFSPFCRRHT